MSEVYLNIYNNLIKLTRNKYLYLNLEDKESFSDRIVFLLLHLSFFFRTYKKNNPRKLLQDIHDFIFKQVEMSIREIGYGDVSINKNMKKYVNYIGNRLLVFNAKLPHQAMSVSRQCYRLRTCIVFKTYRSDANAERLNFYDV